MFATFLGTDPITVGATPDQQKLWLGRVAEEGLLFAYGATEPEAGSDLGALKTKAVPVEENGQVIGYRITGRKQWISNGGIADAWTILANAPGGPTWFVLEKGAEGFSAGKPRGQARHSAQQHRRALPRRRLRPADNLIGAVEGQGLVAGPAGVRLHPRSWSPRSAWAPAGRRWTAPSTTRTQRKVGGSPLSEKQGYTHKLIVPNAVHLEAARAYIEETAERIDAGDEQPQHRGRDRQVHGDRKRQHGRRGRDPGARRLRLHPRVHGRKDQAGRPDHHDLRGHLRDHGDDDRAATAGSSTSRPAGATTTTPPPSLEAVAARDPASGAGTAALAAHALADLLELARIGRLTRSQHVLFRLGELIAWAETAGTFAKTGGPARRRRRRTRRPTPASTRTRWARWPASSPAKPP